MKKLPTNNPLKRIILLIWIVLLRETVWFFVDQNNVIWYGWFIILLLLDNVPLLIVTHKKFDHLDLGKSVDMHITKTGHVHLTKSDSMRQVIYVLIVTRIRKLSALCTSWMLPLESHPSWSCCLYQLLVLTFSITYKGK